MDTAAPQLDEPVITFKGTDIRELSRETLIEAVKEGFSELVTLRETLSIEGRAEAAREEDFQRELSARRDFLGVAAEYQSRIFDASTAYNQIIVLGGYAAFFSVWSSFAGEVDRKVTLASGLLVIVSLLVYVTWTVIGMVQLGRKNIEAVATFGSGIEGFAERLQAVEVSAQQRSVTMLKFWRPVVLISGLTGFAAAMLLGGAALWSLIPKPKAPQPNLTVLASKQAAKSAETAKCYSRVASLYAQTRGGPGSMAHNPRTGAQAVLIDGKWIILPQC